MAWEWASPAATAVAAIVGVTGTAWTSGRGLRNQRQADAERHAREQAAAHEERLHSDRVQAYLNLLDIAQQMGHAIEMTFPMWEENPGNPPPDLPKLEDQMHARARVVAFGSALVRSNMETWNEAVQQFRLWTGPVSRGERGARSELASAREAAREAKKRLEDLISGEIQQRAASGSQWGAATPTRSAGLRFFRLRRRRDPES